MSKQIKIGFDKIPIPTSESLQPLYDIASGIPLKTADGQPIYTKETSEIQGYAGQQNSTPVFINNDSEAPLRVVEQFPESSQTSSSLLGIPRSETQLGIFSDVSTYGLDTSIWEFTSNPSPYSPIEWISRRNPTYGQRRYQRLEEVSNEQAIALTAFPTPWTYPYGIEYEDIGLYNEQLYARYRRFIQLGNIFYDFYNSRGFGEFARQHFISSSFAYVDISSEQVIYNVEDQSISDVFAEVEKWTLTWMQIRDNLLLNPSHEKVLFPPGFDSSNTTPGYQSSVNYFAQLESKKVFRYQPGRISGFTFGVRASTDQGSAQNIIEWGCGNPTDAYMFQIRGASFNIVRRSTIPLPNANLARMGLTPESQIIKSITDPWGIRSSISLYETVIPRDVFNGDPLNGNGQSGYIISFEEVTMYKIEFSWYGAIGAKFYAYVPTGNGGARWVLIHTLVIENEIGKPCLNDPFFKFRYTLNLTDTSNLTAPQYIYKYGASYYIDGGDEGTTTNHTYSSRIADITPNNARSILGIYPKLKILNQDAVPLYNRKTILPTSLSVTSTTAARIDIIECEGCPGHSHHYAPSLVNGTSGIVGTLFIDESGTNATFEPNDPTQTDFIYDDPNLFTKIIADGIYDAYLYSKGDGLMGIARRSATKSTNNIPNKSKTFANTAFVNLSNGSVSTVKNTTFTNVRLSKYRAFAVSNVPLYKSNININFLNPNPRDFRHYADFFIGITNKPYSVDDVTGELLIDNATIDPNTLMYAEYSQYSAIKSTNGFDSGESDYRIGDTFEIDPRLPNPPGVDSGRCSQIKVNVSDVSFISNFSQTNPVTGINGNYLIFGGSAISNFDLTDGEIAIMSELTDSIEGTGITFVGSSAIRFQDTITGSIRYYAEITNPILTEFTEIFIRLVTISGRHVIISKLFTWDIYPLFVVIGMRDRSRINNITIEEFSDTEKFSHTPTWITDRNSSMTIVDSGVLTDGLSNTTGLYESGGLSISGNPATNFTQMARLDAAIIDKQLQQPLRPGQLRCSVYVGENETSIIDLTNIFGQDRNVITPGLFNTNATFVVAKALTAAGEIQASISTKEQ